MSSDAGGPELTGLQQLWLVAALGLGGGGAREFTFDELFRVTAADEVEAAAIWMEVYGLATPVSADRTRWALTAAGVATADRLTRAGQ